MSATAAEGRALRPGIIPLIALCCGVTVSNIYIAYPLLSLMAEAFGLPNADTGIIVTVAQVSYACGLFFFVPLGDVVRRKRLLTLLVTGAGAAALLASFAWNLPMLAVATVLLSAMTVAPHVLIPYVVSSVPQNKIGQTLAIISAGMTAGIVLSRVGGGAVGDFLGWHVVYALAGVSTIAVGLVTAALLPPEAKREGIRYDRLLLSTVRLLKEEPRVRWAIAVQIPSFSTFNFVWAMLVFLLTGPAYGISVAAAGLFGLLSLISMASAPVVGRLIDTKGSNVVMGICLTIAVVGALTFLVSTVHIAFVIAGILLLTIGQQGTTICNQSRILSLRPDARSRTNTLYMTSYFLGGSVSSLLAVIIYAEFGWDGIVVASICSASLAFGVWAVDARRTALRARAQPAMVDTVVN